MIMNKLMSVLPVAVFFIACLWPFGTMQAQNCMSQKGRLSIQGRELIVRNYNSTHEVICGYGMAADVPINTNPIDWNRHAFLVRDLANDHVLLVDTLPWGCHVNDVQFVSLYNNLDGQWVDYCVFCGYWDSTYSYYTITPFKEPGLVTVHDTAGLVGFFSMNAVLNANVNTDSIVVHRVDWTKELYHLTAYRQYYGFYYNQNACPDFDHNAVLDMVGLGDSLLGWRPCFARAKFYPNCNGPAQWDNVVWTSNQTNEQPVDIIHTPSYGAIVSTLQGNDHELWLRWYPKDEYPDLNPSLTHFPPADNVMAIDIHQIAYEDLSHLWDASSSFKGTVRLHAVDDENCVVSLAAYNIDFGIPERGLLSLFVNLAAQSVTKCSWSRGDYTLLDVSAFTDTATSVAVVYDNSQSLYKILMNNWTKTKVYYPLKAILSKKPSLETVDAYTTIGGMPCLHIGGFDDGFVNLLNSWSLMENLRFYSPYEISCLKLVGGMNESMIPPPVTILHKSFDETALIDYGSTKTIPIVRQNIDYILDRIKCQ